MDLSLRKRVYSACCFLDSVMVTCLGPSDFLAFILCYACSPVPVILTFNTSLDLAFFCSQTGLTALKDILPILLSMTIPQIPECCFLPTCWYLLLNYLSSHCLLFLTVIRKMMETPDFQYSLFGFLLDSVNCLSQLIKLS